MTTDALSRLDFVKLLQENRGLELLEFVSQSNCSNKIITMLFLDENLFYLDDLINGIKIAEENLGLNSLLSDEWNFLQATNQKKLKYNKYTREVVDFPE